MTPSGDTYDYVILTTIFGAVTAGSEPAGGAATSEIVIATAMAAVVTTALLVLCAGHRSGRVKLLGWGADLSARVSGLPRTVALPLGIGGGALHIALLGMYWDISLHIDQGRDAGPLANPAHYLILIGLFGIFAAGVIAMALPRDEAEAGTRSAAHRRGLARAGRRPADGRLRRLRPHRLPARRRLAPAVRPGRDPVGPDAPDADRRRRHVARRHGRAARRRARGRRRVRASAQTLRKVGLMGGLLIGLSTFQGEFDFGVPQFRMVFHPLLIAFAAAFALVAARLWIGRGGALYAALFFLLIRGIVSLFTGPIFGEVTPTMALYIPEALLVEAAAVAFLKRGPLAFGAASGALVGTLGMAAEWGWTHVAFRLPWTTDILPEGLILAIVAGLAGGAFGVLLGTGLRGELVRPRVARPVALAALVAIAACVADGLVVQQDTTAKVVRRRPRRPHLPRHREGRLVGDRDRLAGQGRSCTSSRCGASARATTASTAPRPVDRHLEGDDPRPGRAPDPLRPGPAAGGHGHPGEGRRRCPISRARSSPTRRSSSASRSRTCRASLKTIAPLIVLLIALSFAGALAWGVARIGGTGQGAASASRFAADRGDAAASLNPSHGSPPRRRSATSRSVQARGPMSSDSSSSRSGMATGAPGLARTAHGATEVCALRLRRVSTNTRPSRFSFLNAVVSASGASSTSAAASDFAIASTSG